MTFQEAVTNVFQNYANFSGRARRSEYWYFCLFNVLVSTVLSTLATWIGLFKYVGTIYELAVLVPGLAVAWRRMHDVGKSGGYNFMVLIPLVGWIFVLIKLVQDSDPGDNAYGPNPKMVINGVDAYEDNNGGTL